MGNLEKQRQQEAVLRGNILARGLAEDAVNVHLPEYLTLEGQDASPERFWEKLAELAAAKCGKVLYSDSPAVRPMTDTEAKKFAQSTVENGTHKGKRVSQVPASYWVFITETKFQKMLQRYVASDFFQRQGGRF